VEVGSCKEGCAADVKRDCIVISYRKPITATDSLLACWESVYASLQLSISSKNH
jgi:hypothetical protein